MPDRRPPIVTRLRETLRLLPHVGRTFRILWQTSPLLALAVAALTVATGVIPAALAWVGKLIVDSVVVAARAGGLSGASRPLRLVALELGLMVVLTLANRLSALLRELLRAQLGNRINVDILEKALALELRHFEDAAFYDKMQRARREASSRPLSMVLGVLGIAQNAITLSSYAFLLARLSALSVVILVAASIPAFITETRMSSQSFRLNSWRAPEARRLNYLEWILTRDSHVKEVKLFALGRLMLDRYRALFEKFYREDRALAQTRFVYGLLLTLLSLGAFYACYAFAARRAAFGGMTLGDLTLYVTVFRQGQSAFQSVLGGVAGLYEDALFMSNLFEYLDLPGDLAQNPQRVPNLPRWAPAGEPPAPDANPPASAPQAIELRNVSFRYPGKENWALRDVNLTIAPGEVIAFVGENGAGKSTLIHLLMRMYEPTEGEILYGGRTLKEVPLDELHRRIGAVFQDFVRYQFSVAENIGLGWVPALEDRARIEKAAGAGGADAVVSSLPRGYDTMLGGYFEAGQELSVGQWQKIAIARAFMRDAEVLILDEPTASLDAEAEHEMWKRFKALAHGRTAILISHRMSTVRLAERIVVLRGGRIEELGTHAELLARDGRYAHLFRLQAAGYLD